MGVTAVYNKDDDLMLATVVGEVNFQEIGQAIFNMLKDPNFRQDINIIWDATQAKINMNDPNKTAMFELTSKLSQFSEQRGYGKTALVVSSNLYFGLARQFQNYMAETPRSVHVFKDMDAAKTWLGE
ncbi:MAG: hypothetical protein OEW58_04355 [Gammaproteobacteria bacterium]|nr:hypothetical protein [Gammaproteobacteria bacterium]